MQIATPQSYLVLGAQPGYDPPSIKITSDFEEVLANWQPGTRCSPVWGVSVGGGRPVATFEFPQTHLLVLIGPIQFASLCSDLKQVGDPNTFTIWATAGALNVILLAEWNEASCAALEEIKSWVAGKNGALEWWQVKNGFVVDGGTHFPNREHKCVPGNLKQLAKKKVSSLLTVALQEYCALMASALSRARALVPFIHDDLEKINNVIVAEVELYATDSRQYIDIYLRLLNINAALSRFTSQAFSGIPPVLQSECHYWIHSLLGTGTANIAFSRLASHIVLTFGEAKIAERLRAMESRVDKVPSLERIDSAEFLREDNLATQEPESDAGDPIPLITYFSGRDGFSSHIYTLSAPLSTISECNSLRSSLLTVTHELAHIQIRGVLGVVYPDLDNGDDDVISAMKLLRPNFQAENWLQAARQLLLEGIVSLASEARGNSESDSNELSDPQRMREMFREWRRETQEILVHTFDFLYFYSAKPDDYISSIWHSWCAIPGIGDRVPEYVTRTLCAIGANFLTEDNNTQLEMTRDYALMRFKILRDSGDLSSNYVASAIEYLERYWDSSNGSCSVRNKLRAGFNLTRFVRAFLYSEAFTAKIYSEKYITSSRTKGSAYAKKKNEFDLLPIGNPLRFLSENIRNSPTEADSLWVLHNLAYNSSKE